MRFFFVGYQVIASRTKSTPDRHSLGAAFARKDEIAALPLRHPEVLDWIERYERAPALLPCAAYGWSGPAAPAFREVLERED